MKKVFKSTVALVAAMVILFGSAEVADRLGYPTAKNFLSEQGEKVHAAYVEATQISPTVVQ